MKRNSNKLKVLKRWYKIGKLGVMKRKRATSSMRAKCKQGNPVYLMKLETSLTKQKVENHKNMRYRKFKQTDQEKEQQMKFARAERQIYLN